MRSKLLRDPVDYQSTKDSCQDRSDGGIQESHHVREKLLYLVDKIAALDEQGRLSGTDREDIIARMKELLLRSWMLFFKTFGAATFWEASSNLITFNPAEIRGGRALVGYSACTALGSAAGTGLLAFFALMLGKKVFGVEAIGGDVLSTKNLCQTRQLFFNVFLTDCFWASAFRGAKAMWHTNVAGQIFSGVPLFVLGPWFILVSKMVHKVSVGCGLVAEADSYHPSFRSFDASISVGIGAVVFALATALSTQKHLLTGAIENNFLAGVADALLTGTLTGVGSTVLYIVLLVVLGIVAFCWDDQSGSRSFISHSTTIASLPSSLDDRSLFSLPSLSCRPSSDNLSLLSSMPSPCTK